MARTRARKATSPFEQRLVLSQYMLGLFGVETFDELAEGLRGPEYEAWDENNVSRLHPVLAARFFDLPKRTGGPSTDDLLRYDGNIVGHTLRISEKRDERIDWKYFQYLSLLFAEVYLDRYFSEPNVLLADLNIHVRLFNEGRSEADKVPEYAPDDLRKLAFWMATGSGKTLLMHINVLQYRHYLGLHGRADELDRIILLTPNEGLSRQHQQELEKSGFEAELFSRSGESLFTSRQIQILEITKLREDTGVKTIAVEAFEGNNLVLVDEGHRGTSKASDVVGDKGWKPMRDVLCDGGFSFEYSATFGQAMKAANNKKLADEYAKCILFDYSYRHFYGDGYGKDYRVLNLEEGSEDSFRHRYLVAAMLVFHQQQLFFADHEKELQPYGIERPLWMFVGSSVTKKPSKDDRTDVVNILLLLARFVRQREESVGILERLMSGRTNLNFKGRDLFADSFNYLMSKGLTADELYDSILSNFFNATGSFAARLHASILKGAEGEVSLHLGYNEPFGVINVGDPSALSKLLEDQEDLVVSERSVSGSLFNDLNTRESGVNLLVGARKFTEGWSSWRVSSMGLMNVGKNEGSQIIQLFGRGVRLKGLDFSLKRSSRIPDTRHPRHIGILETLNVFGVSADYMQQFKEHLEEEGLPSNDDVEEIILPVVKTLDDKKLKTIRLGKGGDFKYNGPRLKLNIPAALGDAVASKLTVKLDWYPKIGALGSRNGTVTAVRDIGKLGARHLAFMDLDEIFFELVHYKEERGWHNLTVSREKMIELLENPDWYELTIPSEDLKFAPGSLGRRVRIWQEIATSLLKAYCKKYYDTRRAEFESAFLQYQVLTQEDPNFLEEYRFQVQASAEATVNRLRELKIALEDGCLKPLEWGALDIFSFDQHLYKPLVHLKNKDVSVKPLALNEGEQRFVRDLKTFYEQQSGFFEDKELYLLRNMSRGKGIGFFEAGNFYPDFILWLVIGIRQYIAFIDPKGIRNLAGLHDPKIRFHETIKEIEARLDDEDVTLDSFIVSNTPYEGLASWGVGKKEFNEHNVLFQSNDKETYVRSMLEQLLSERRREHLTKTMA